MATFGPTASPFANVLFNPIAVDQAVQGRQRNQLMMANSQQDQAQQTFQRDATARIGMARELSALPEQQAAAEWGTYRQRLQASGLGQGLPEQFPGMERLKAVASSDMTTFQRMQLDERKRASEALMGLIGGGAPAASGGASGAAPAQPGGAVPAVPADLAPVISQASQDTSVPAPLLTALFQQESRLGQDPRATANGGGVAQIISSTARDPGYGMQPISAADRLDPNKAIPWAARYLAARNPGVDWNDPTQRDAALRRYNGGGDPNYVQNVTRNLPGAQAAAPAAPVMPQLDQNGLTQQQRALVAAAGPERGIGMMAQFQQQNRMEVDRATDRQRQTERDTRQSERDRIADDQRLVENQRRDETARLQADAAKRQAETAGVPSGYRRTDAGALEPIPGGPADPAAAAARTSSQAREAVRKAEVEVGRISTAIDRFEQVFREQGGAGLGSVMNNPRDPKAQQLLGAYEAMKATLRSEAFLNTGVLQPAEAKMLDDMLLSPQSIRGAMASPDAMSARLGEFRTMINRGLEQQRASAGASPSAPGVQGPSPGSTAEPPAAGGAAAPRRLRFNPATGKIE